MDQAGLELTNILLPLPPRVLGLKAWATRSEALLFGFESESCYVAPVASNPKQPSTWLPPSPPQPPGPAPSQPALPRQGLLCTGAAWPYHLGWPWPSAGMPWYAAEASQGLRGLSELSWPSCVGKKKEKRKRNTHTPPTGGERRWAAP